MSLDVEDSDEEMQLLIGDSMQLADELVTVTATEELQRLCHTTMKDIESGVEQYERMITSFKESLDRLALLEHGILHGLNKVSAAPSEINGQLDRLESKVETLGEQLRETIVYLPPTSIAKEAFAFIGAQKDWLSSMEQNLDLISSMVDGAQLREMAMTVASVQRKMTKLMQDMDGILKLNTLQKQTIVGFSNRIFHGNMP